jgi:hypothetical protein
VAYWAVGRGDAVNVERYEYVLSQELQCLFEGLKRRIYAIERGKWVNFRIRLRLNVAPVLGRTLMALRREFHESSFVRRELLCSFEQR